MMIYQDKKGKVLTEYEQESAKKGLLDYQAYDEEIAIGIYEAIGYRSSQEDRVAYEASEIFSNVDPLVRLSMLKEKISFLQKTLGQLSDEGSTLICSVILEDIILTAHVGDSAAFLVLFNNDGSTAHFERLNKHLHNPDLNTAEGQRACHIASQNHLPCPYERYGVWRLGDGLALSRAIGDLSSEPFGLIHTPEAEITPLSSSHKGFVILACDGLTERLTLRQLQFLIEDNKNRLPHELAKILVYNALKSGSQDNVSVMVASLPTKPPFFSRSMVLFDGHGGNRTAQALSENFFML